MQSRPARAPHGASWPPPRRHILPHMSQNLPADKQGASPPSSPRKGRISPAIRRAIKIKVEKAVTIEEACREAGCSPAGYYKAMNRPNVQKHLEEVKAQYVQRIESMEAVHKARALEVARELLEQRESRPTQARMVEFLRGESKKPSVSVTLNQQFNGDYAFAPRGARVVEIVQSDDISEAQAGESTE